MPNQFATFAGDAVANVMPINDYLDPGFTPRVLGFQTGVALSAELNRAWRQASLIASMIGQFTADVTGLDMLDDGTPAGMTALETNFTQAISAVARAAVPQGNWVLRSGDTMTGDLRFEAPVGTNAGIIMQRGAGQYAILQAQTAALARWQLIPADSSPETGSNAGSNFEINRFADDGNYLGTPMSISRANGQVNFERSPTVNGENLPYLPLAGGNLYGAMGSGGVGVSYLGLGWYNYFAFGWNGDIHVAVDGTYIGALATHAWANNLVGAYLPIAGGTVYNVLVSNGPFIGDSWAAFRSSVSFSNLGDFVNFYDGRNRFRQWSSGWYDYFDEQTGTRVWHSNWGADMVMDGSANLYLSGQLTANGGRIRSINGGFAPSVCAYWTGGVATGFWSDGSGMWLGNMDGNGSPTSGHVLIDNNGTGTIWGNWNATGQIWAGGAIVASSDLVVYGNANIVSGSLWASWLGSRGDIHAEGHLHVGSNADVYGILRAHQQVQAVGGGWGSVSAWSTDNGNCEGFWVTNQINFGHLDGGGNPQWAIWAVSDSQYVIRYETVFFANPAGGWSDERMKDHIAPAPAFDSLDAICRTSLFSFDWKSGNHVHVPHSFIAQNVEETLPDAVAVCETEPAVGMKAINVQTMMAHAFRAIRQLTERLEKIEGATT